MSDPSTRGAQSQAVSLEVQLGPLRLRNPVMVASGPFGFGEEYGRYFDLNRLGAVVVKSVTLEPTPGNPPPRVVATPAGMLNSIGWQNPGLEGFKRLHLPFLQGLEVPVIVNVAGYTVDEYARLAEALSALPNLAALEANISCPNVEHGGKAFGTDPATAAAVVRAMKNHTGLPVIPKLAPNVTSITEMALAVEEAGADLISLINAPLGMAVDTQTWRPRIARVVAGLSGPAIKPLALALTWQTVRAVKVPVIAMGGIGSAEDAAEFLLAGARAVAVGTALFADPLAPIRVIEGLEAYLRQHRLGRVTDLVGRLILEGEDWERDGARGPGVVDPDGGNHVRPLPPDLG